MKNNDLNLKYYRFKKSYRERPLAFFKNVLKVKLSVQQQKIIRIAALEGIRVAVKSATGTGKTFICAGLIIHQLLVEDNIKILATAPSAGQLARGLKSEVSMLHGRLPDFLQDILIVKTDKVEVSGLPFNFCSFVSADTDNQESLAGLHAQKVIIINDEASALTDKAYDTLMGNLTTEGSSMINISNPVRSEGKFRDLWRNPKMEKHWSLFTLDAFGCPFISTKWIQEIEDSYGKDSDMYRMRVLGEFPRIAEDIFFSSDSIESAFNRTLNRNAISMFPKIFGLDVARFGSDKTVFVIRQGPAILDYEIHAKVDTQEVAALAVSFQSKHRATAICVDGIGVGAGVVDRLRALKQPVIDITVNSKATNPKTYFNMRSQLYGEMKEWLANEAVLPEDRSLREQLESIRYGFNNKLQLQIISKIDLKKRYKCASPDFVDSIMLTFYQEWADYKKPMAGIHSQKRNVKSVSFPYN